MLCHAFFLKQEIFKVRGVMLPVYWTYALVKGFLLSLGFRRLLMISIIFLTSLH
jgi:hypothetical protein